MTSNEKNSKTISHNKKNRHYLSIKVTKVYRDNKEKIKIKENV